MRQITVPISQGMPYLILLSDGRLALTPPQVCTYELRTVGVSSLFDTEGFSLLDEGITEWQDYSYNSAYYPKHMLLLSKWIIQQNLNIGDN